MDLGPLDRVEERPARRGRRLFAGRKPRFLFALLLMDVFVQLRQPFGRLTEAFNPVELAFDGIAARGEFPLAAALVGAAQALKFPRLRGLGFGQITAQCLGALRGTPRALGIGQRGLDRYRKNKRPFS